MIGVMRYCCAGDACCHVVALSFPGLVISWLIAVAFLLLCFEKQAVTAYSHRDNFYVGGDTDGRIDMLVLQLFRQRREFTVTNNIHGDLWDK